MAETISLNLSSREVHGKKVKQLRAQGVIPVHMYGGKMTPANLQVSGADLRKVLERVGGNVPLSIEVDGTGENICFVREVQRHPVTEEVLHVDFLRVEATQVVTADVPIVLEGEAPAVRNLGGTLAQPLQSLTVEALPANMPAELRLDVGGLEDFEMAVRVADIIVGPDVTVLNEPRDMVARVMAPRLEEEFEAVTGEEAEVEGEEIEGEEAEGEEAAEGDAEEEAE